MVNKQGGDEVVVGPAEQEEEPADGMGRTALWKAARDGDAERCTALIDGEGADVNRATRTDDNPMNAGRRRFWWRSAGGTSGWCWCC